MQVANLSFYCFLLVIQSIITYAWINHPNQIVIIETLRSTTEFAIRVVCLLLVQHFGAKITVKSFLNQNGDLVIVGVDSSNKQSF
jgi:hypothetical protein